MLGDSTSEDQDWPWGSGLSMRIGLVVDACAGLGHRSQEGKRHSCMHTAYLHSRLISAQHNTVLAQTLTELEKLLGLSTLAGRRRIPRRRDQAACSATLLIPRQARVAFPCGAHGSNFGKCHWLGKGGGLALDKDWRQRRLGFLGE
jgi:hypothetical protein